jgi:hypothetical protein|nr:MAG TPA: hypothetical protein [Caudoviricetes sp.]
MNIKDILTKPVGELTIEQQEQAIKFLKGMYNDLLKVVGGKTRNEKDKIIKSLSFEEKIKLVEEYRRARK